MVSSQDEPLFLHDDDEVTPAEYSKGFWKILIVDDDQEIHAVTKMALADVIISGRQLEFFHAYSGSEALDRLTEHDDIAMVLLDVVMETDDAGLKVAQAIREQLGNDEIRIVLRTGQPGYAPEESVVKNYDINDYKTKTELTRSRLLTTVFSAVRSYQQLCTINENRRGLRKIIHSASNLMEKHSIVNFSEGVVTQIASLLGLNAEGIVGARAPHKDNDILVLGAAGHFANSINKSLSTLNSDEIEKNVRKCLNEQRHIHTDTATVFFIDGQAHQAAAYIETKNAVAEYDQELLEVFLANIAVGFENANLFEELRTAAYLDPLTGIPNRAEFTRCLQVLSEKPDKDKMIAVIDIDHFSDVNDGLGQDVGNLLLRAVALRLTDQLGDKVFVSRISADVFGVYGPANIVTPNAFSELFALPFRAGEHYIPLRVTCGFASATNPESVNGKGLLKQVYIALKNAKNNSFDRYNYYEPSMEQDTQRRLHLVRRLRADFANRKLQVWYQPQVELKTKKVVGVEALLRWPQSDGSFISPAEFIPLAEYSGLIVEIGSWVIEEACRQINAFDEIGLPQLRVAVNVSVPQFRKRDFPELVEKQIEQWGIDPTRIELEITESIVMEDPDLVADILRRLKQQGIQVAIDDFGVGFSSLSYLQKLPLDRIKIDKTFVNNSDEKSGKIIIETIVDMARRLGLKVLAEGIEEQSQLDYFLGLDCTEGQGFFFAKPMPADQLICLLQKQMSYS
ncbi:response regulator receiver modulated diguanylate cyclase/phosphodiesterase [Idiomarina loihiensis]|jgi:diguanylate cyclase (GGDEF)-like protein|uniref:Signaling protein (CHEY,EAL,GGDEF domains) n=1 Tax=Idiomarina loihiensis (strain ATCC BAA-735 / DSM 15497 / L2-TR) TaxID=283942 RepID=Q5QVS7_IDILO|nr:MULTISPECIES: EAL domain-containing protein [Idiomarina]PHQ88895.1 MAG: diguanylate phosphodiesterase [Idiomarina sp.]AAV83099.1 Signaling protein (CHEY,EAL,GGDEF domains) [Idiomarina loihiensis L2TR]AGM37144.1 signal protein [Idiomarina loihiensis GSL 199]PWW34090.1 response regulator receiver modulated diguanylate cyclase/phosphodiesterase [Idiomarina loihiensis]TDP44177.1 response regulator receiver modulated diguanylate cyclase/phosphodiesterase [Idiomarina loihiensis]